MKLIHHLADAPLIHKHGVDISVYGGESPLGVVYEETEVGHLEEFYDIASTYTWFIIEGSGTFIINGEQYPVGAKDLVVVPPNSRIYYLGKLKMLLSTSPTFDESNVRHVRDVDIPDPSRD